MTERGGGPGRPQGARKAVSAQNREKRERKGAEKTRTLFSGSSRHPGYSPREDHFLLKTCRKREKFREKGCPPTVKRERKRATGPPDPPVYDRKGERKSGKRRSNNEAGRGEERGRRGIPPYHRVW